MGLPKKSALKHHSEAEPVDHQRQQWSKEDPRDAHHGALIRGQHALPHELAQQKAICRQPPDQNHRSKTGQRRQKAVVDVGRLRNSCHCFRSERVATATNRQCWRARTLDRIRDESPAGRGGCRQRRRAAVARRDGSRRRTVSDRTPWMREPRVEMTVRTGTQTPDAILTGPVTSLSSTAANARPTSTTCMKSRC